MPVAPEAVRITPPLKPGGVLSASCHYADRRSVGAASEAADPVTVTVVRNLPETGKQQLPSASVTGGQHLRLKNVRTAINAKGVVVRNTPRNDGVIRSLGSSDRACSSWSGPKLKHFCLISWIILVHEQVW